MAKARRRGEGNLEYLEFASGTIITVLLTVFDSYLIFVSSEDKKASKLSHDYFEGFLISLIASSCLIMLLRWYRSHEEIIESINRYQSLKEVEGLEERVSEITNHCIEIHKRNWPECASEMVNTQLDHLRDKLAEFESGRFEIEYGEAITHSPKFFELADGISFVTDYGRDEYWESDGGKQQLASNERVLQDRPNSIVRVFILPPYVGSAERAPNINLDRLDKIFEEQLKAGVQLRVVAESKLDANYRRDIGFFFKDRKAEKALLVSEWLKPHADSQNRKAVLSFEGDAKRLGREMYSVLIEQSVSKRISTIADWRAYKDDPKNHANGSQ